MNMMTQTTNRIHPLVAVAAISVTVVSLLGIAALTGILPNSHGSVADARSHANQVIVAPALPASTPQALATDASGRKPTAHRTAANSVAYAPPPAPVQQKPAEAQHNSAVGIGVGAVIGGILGSQVGGGDGKTLATIAGAVGGGYIGNEVAKRNQ